MVQDAFWASFLRRPKEASGAPLSRVPVPASHRLIVVSSSQRRLIVSTTSHRLIVSSPSHRHCVIVVSSSHRLIVVSSSHRLIVVSSSHRLIVSSSFHRFIVSSSSHPPEQGEPFCMQHTGSNNSRYEKNVAKDVQANSGNLPEHLLRGFLGLGCLSPSA